MENFENQLIDVINANQLPFEAKWYVVRHIYELVNNEYHKQMGLVAHTQAEEQKTEPQE